MPFIGSINAVRNSLVVGTDIPSSGIRRKNTGNIITGDSNSHQNRIESIRFKKSSNVSIILTYLLLQANSLDSNK